MIETTLSQLTLSITDGKHGDCQSDENSGYYFISCKDIKDGVINYENARQITEQDFIETHKRTMLEPNDILVTNSGTIGRMSFVKDVPLTYRTTFQKSVAIVKPDANKVLPKYLYYLLQYCVDDFINQSNGSAQKNLLLSTMRSFKIKYNSDKEKQKNLVDILSAYDDLIENNQKQIKLLEEAAQRLYKEWFVDLRFPGYETTPIIDGVPEGWKQEPIDEVYSIKYGKNLPTTEISEAGKYPVYGANGVIGYYHKFNCDSYVTLITSRGNGSGDVSRTHHSNSFVTNNSFIVIPQQTHNFISNEFTYWLMKYTDFKSVCTGSAQPQLTNNSISTLKVLIPTKKLILCFCEITRMYFENVEKLLRQNRLLIEARDRLLPKLMNGELEV